MTFSFDITTINDGNIKGINDGNLTRVLTAMKESFTQFNNTTEQTTGKICGKIVNINDPNNDIEQIRLLLNQYVYVLQYIKNLPTVENSGNPNKIITTPINLGGSEFELKSTHQTTFVDYLIMVLNRKRDTLTQMRKKLRTKIATLNSNQNQEEKQQIINEIVKEYAMLDNPNINLNPNINIHKPNEGIISLLSSDRIIANFPVKHFNFLTFVTIKLLLTDFVKIIQNLIHETSNSQVDRATKLVSGGGSTKKYRKNKKRKSKKRSSARILRRRQRSQTQLNFSQ